MNPIFRRLLRQATRLASPAKLLKATALVQRTLAASRPTTLPGRATRARLMPMPMPMPMPSPGWGAKAPAHRPTPPVPGQGDFTGGRHTHAGLTRDYKLYLPRGAADRPRPLVVMLHGCKQDATDFATGTGMNALADEYGVMVLYPEQAQDANPARCWNWFKHNHQGSRSGEAALIANLAQAVVAQHHGDPGRVYIAGLSAGGAMATLVAAAHPGVFAAVGVHSGLAPGAANNVQQGLAAMRSGAVQAPGAAASPRATLPLPTIVFHGDMDATVHARNGDQVMAAALAGNLQTNSARAVEPEVDKGVSKTGRRFTRTTYGTAPAVGEHWLLHGAGHAWSGGQASGSYTDPRGPNASREMLRFFLSQPTQPGR